jgi:hypothetical protein
MKQREEEAVRIANGFLFFFNRNPRNKRRATANYLINQNDK